MAVRSSFTAGEVLTAADLTDTFAAKVDYATPANAQSGTGASAYTFVLADASRLTTATGTTAKTFTIPPQANVAWVANSIIRVANYGAGDLTIAGGSGVTVTNATKTLAQFESAALVRTGSNAWTLIPFSGGAGNADFSDAADGTYTDGGVTWKWKQYTASSTLTITRAGFADVLVVGAGGSGGSNGGGGGAGHHYYVTDCYLPVGSHTVTVGAGAARGGTSNAPGEGGNGSRLGTLIIASGGGGAGSRNVYNKGQVGASGGGAGRDSTSGAGTAFVDAVTGYSGAVSSTTANAGAGGGGGSSAAGVNGNGGLGGAGGAGTANSITGTSVTRAGGGGGGGGTGAGGSGGSGGGGAGGAAPDGTGVNGIANTGGGGGGGGASSGLAGNGGSGIVIVRVKV